MTMASGNYPNRIIDIFGLKDQYGPLNCSCSFPEPFVVAGSYLPVESFTHVPYIKNGRLSYQNNLPYIELNFTRKHWKTSKQNSTSRDQIIASFIPYTSESLIYIHTHITTL